MRIDTTLGQLITGLNHLLVLNLDSGTVRNQIGLGVACFCIGNNNLTFLLCIFNIYHAAELGNDSKSLRLTGLKKLLDTRKTLCNIAACNTARMEGTHGQLSTWLTDRLCSNNTNCLTNLNRLSCSHVCAVALCTDSHMGFTGQNGTDLYGITSQLL